MNRSKPGLADRKNPLPHLPRCGAPRTTGRARQQSGNNPPAPDPALRRWARTGPCRGFQPLRGRKKEMLLNARLHEDRPNAAAGEARRHQPQPAPTARQPRPRRRAAHRQHHPTDHPGRPGRPAKHGAPPPRSLHPPAPCQPRGNSGTAFHDAGQLRLTACRQSRCRIRRAPRYLQCRESIPGHLAAQIPALLDRNVSNTVKPRAR